VRRAISRLLTPALQCKEFVHGELLRIAGQSAPLDVARFPGLQVGSDLTLGLLGICLRINHTDAAHLSLYPYETLGFNTIVMVWP
jgi:hypothetical protein